MSDPEDDSPDDAPNGSQTPLLTKIKQETRDVDVGKILSAGGVGGGVSGGQAPQSLAAPPPFSIPMQFPFPHPPFPSPASVAPYQQQTQPSSASSHSSESSSSSQQTWSFEEQFKQVRQAIVRSCQRADVFDNFSDPNSFWDAAERHRPSATQWCSVRVKYIRRHDDADDEFNKPRFRDEPQLPAYLQKLLLSNLGKSWQRACHSSTTGGEAKRNDPITSSTSSEPRLLSQHTTRTAAPTIEQPPVKDNSKPPFALPNDLSEVDQNRDDRPQSETSGIANRPGLFFKSFPINTIRTYHLYVNCGQSMLVISIRASGRSSQQPAVGGETPDENRSPGKNFLQVGHTAQLDRARQISSLIVPQVLFLSRILSHRHRRRLLIISNSRPMELFRPKLTEFKPSNQSKSNCFGLEISRIKIWKYCVLLEHHCFFSEVIARRSRQSRTTSCCRECSQPFGGSPVVYSSVLFSRRLSQGRLESTDCQAPAAYERRYTIICDGIVSYLRSSTIPIRLSPFHLHRPTERPDRTTPSSEQTADGPNKVRIFLSMSTQKSFVPKSDWRIFSNISEFLKNFKFSGKLREARTAVSTPLPHSGAPPIACCKGCVHILRKWKLPPSRSHRGSTTDMSDGATETMSGAFFPLRVTRRTIFPTRYCQYSFADRNTIVSVRYPTVRICEHFFFFLTQAKEGHRAA
ncbi:unnamed protein product, partial [Nesidiocoris tenuis]